MATTLRSVNSSNPVLLTLASSPGRANDRLRHRMPRVGDVWHDAIRRRECRCACRQTRRVFVARATDRGCRCSLRS
jgi:hypothetical protein